MTDRIFIEGLQTDAVIGVYDWERTIRQPLVFDLELATDATMAATDDCIDHALDYAAIAQCIIREVGNSEYQLLETLLEHLALTLQQQFKVSWMRLKVTKPNAVPEATGVGLVIERGNYSRLSGL